MKRVNLPGQTEVCMRFKYYILGYTKKYQMVLAILFNILVIVAFQNC